MEPAPDADPDNQITSTEVRPSDHTRQTDRAVYRIDPRTSGMELRLDPRPDDRSNRPTDRLSRPTRHSKDDSRTRLSLGREDHEDKHAFTLLGRLEHSDQRASDLQSVFDPFLDFHHPNFSKARILHLSEDLGHAWTRLIHQDHPTDRPNQPACVLLLTVMDAIDTNEPGRVGEGSHRPVFIKFTNLDQECLNFTNFDSLIIF
ncbi:hypothetical protein N665_0158s0052 [Sinapis alba]|nr:hypothetical protein N665_0158s0052 [Sinapis alba]